MAHITLSRRIRVTGHAARRRRPGRPGGPRRLREQRHARHGTTNKTVTFGSNYSDDVPKKAFADTLAKFDTEKGYTTKVNTVDHNSFQENITRYLQGNPDDAYTWFAGFRMRYFAAQGLAQPIDDVWDTIGANYSDAFKKASTGDDGKKYFVPFYNYPWALFYRKSLWQAKGYEVPKTIDDLKTLGAKMKADGLAPDRLRRQGRLARHGHVRPAQHAAERLRLPHQPDGVQGVVDRPEGQGRLRPVEGPAAAAPGRRQRAHLAGGRAGPRRQEVRHVPARQLRGPAVQGRRPRRPRLLRLPGGRLARSARARSRRRSTAS